MRFPPLQVFGCLAQEGHLLAVQIFMLLGLLWGLKKGLGEYILTVFNSAAQRQIGRPIVLVSKK